MKNSIKTLAMWLIIGIIFIIVLSSIMENSNTKLKYSELITKINEGKVESIEIEADGKTATVELSDDKVKKEVNIPDMGSFMTYTEDFIKNGAFTLEEKSESIFITILSLLTPFGLLIIFMIFWFFMMGGMNSNQTGGKTLSFGKSKARMMTPADRNKVSFDDVAGVDEEKEELEEIVQFLKNPKIHRHGSKNTKRSASGRSTRNRKNTTCKSSSRRSWSTIFHNKWFRLRRNVRRCWSIKSKRFI